MRKSGEWGDGVMLATASRLYSRQINVVLADKCVTVPFSSSKPTTLSPIYIGYDDVMKHYVYLEPKSPQLQSSSDLTAINTSTGKFSQANEPCFQQ